MEDKRTSGVPKTRSKRRRWGQICLMIAAILNSFVLLINIHLSGLGDELASKREEERYFAINQQTKYGEISKYTLLQTNLNQLLMLRRLAKGRFTPEENQMLLMNEKIVEGEINASFRKAVIVTYLQGNDPPPGEDPQEMFSNMTHEQLFTLIPELEDQALQRVSNLKTEMVTLMDKISLWKKLYSYSLIISSITIVIANLFIFAVSRSGAPRS